MTHQPPGATSRTRSPRPPLRSSRFARELGHVLSVRRRLLAAGLAAGAVACGLTAVRPAPPPTVRIVAAAQDLAAGTRLARTHLTTVSLPARVVPDGSLHEWASAKGRVLATPMRRGEPLTDVRLAGPRLLSGYGDGLVATPVRIADPGTARLLRAGDRVDVLAASANGERAAEQAARSVAPSVAVIAVPRPGAGSRGLAAEGALVLLATTPEQAAALAQAATTSRLSVVIRNADS